MERKKVFVNELKVGERYRFFINNRYLSKCSFIVEKIDDAGVHIRYDFDLKGLYGHNDPSMFEEFPLSPLEKELL